MALSRIAARSLLILAACLFVFAPSLARADEAGAEALFQEGLAAMKRTDYTAACDAFSQSNRADPSPGTQINLALCFEKQKKWASAWTWYRSAVGLAQQRGQKERETLAEDSANRLKPQLHYIVVVVKEAPSDMIVKRDNSEVPVMVAGKEVPLPIDPGDHLIEVSARGKKTQTQKIHCNDDNKTDRVEFPKLENAPVEDRGAGGAASGTGSDYRPPVVVNDGSTQRTIGIVVGGSGILAGLAGVGLFILAKNEESERDDLRKQALGKTGDEKIALDRSASSHDKAASNNQLIAIILGAGAVVLVGVGAVLYFTAPKAGGEKTAKAKAKPPAPTKNVVPLVGPSFGGLGLSGTF